MPKRFERILRVGAYGLALILAVQFVMLLVRRNPLSGLEVPLPPRWNPSTEVTALDSSSKPPTGSSNLPAGGTNLAMGTNLALGTNVLLGTNALLSTNVASGTNLVFGGTNVVLATNTVTTTTNVNTATNLLVVTNSPPETNVVNSTNLLSGTNQIAGTNWVGGTNSVILTNTTVAARPPGPPPGPGGSSPRKPPRPATPLPPLIQARIDRVTSSEMLAPVLRPPPMALLGLAGHHAFIRTPNGQSALLREGGESDGIKLLRLGTNRVLIEQAGEKKELTIFNGFGSESLLTK